MTIHESKDDHCRLLAASLNRDCFSLTLSPEALHQTLESDRALHGMYRFIADERPNLFAKTPYFVSSRQIERIAEIVHAIDSVVALPAYQEQALAWAPEIAKFDPGPLGVFFGYDFHLQGTDPQLIEINTNAGGALLNTTLARAQYTCCQKMDGLSNLRDTIAPLEQKFVDMFRTEWHRQRGDAALKTVAIIDVEPEHQYLNLEFRLFERLFHRHGINAVVADPTEMEFRDNSLWYRDLKIDLIYNRLTDFSLSEPVNEAIRNAYLGNHVVLTPHPSAHALYADKRNLSLLSNEALLHSWGVPDSTRNILRSCIPNTVLVTKENSEVLWSKRRRLFFKPRDGYGSKATYRGDKLTRRVWQEILTADYVAQEIVPPSVRRLQAGGEPVTLKVDVRAYVYNGCVQLLAARMYQGQTTNFRTTGGGFAAVFVIDDTRSCNLKLAAASEQIPAFINPFHFFNEDQQFSHG